jgi:hypothetical protein
MRIRDIMLYAIMLFAVSACSNDDTPELSARIPLTVNACIDGGKTRVAYSDDGAGDFEKGDVIYVSKLVNGNVDKSDYVNIKYVHDGEKFKPENSSETYYFDTDGSNVNFAASTRELLGSRIILDISGTNEELESRYPLADQTSGLSENNFLYANTSCSIRNPEADFTFCYELSKITLNFSSEISSCTISGSNIGTNATIHTGYLVTSSTGSVKCYVDSEAPTKAEAILFPCNTSAEINIEVVADGKTYNGTLPSTAIVANTHYIYNIKINSEDAQ